MLPRYNGYMRNILDLQFNFSNSSFDQIVFDKIAIVSVTKTLIDF